MKVVRWSVSLIVVVGLLTAVGGCSPDTQTQPSGDGGAAAPQTPSAFDIYLGDRVDIIDYAERKEVSECMAKVGYPQIRDAGVMRFDGEENKLDLDVARALGYTSEADARERGFGRSVGPEAARIVSFDANFDHAFQACESEIAAELLTGDKGVVKEYTALGGLLGA